MPEPEHTIEEIREALERVSSPHRYRRGDMEIVAEALSELERRRAADPARIERMASAVVYALFHTEYGDEATDIAQYDGHIQMDSFDQAAAQRRVEAALRSAGEGE